MINDEFSKLVYVDTSGYLAVLFGEKGHHEVESVMQKYRLCSSIFLAAEAERTIIHAFRRGVIPSDRYRSFKDRFISDLEKFVFKELTREIATLERFPSVLTPKSADLVHLRTACWFKNTFDIAGFLTLDLHQKACAEDLGFVCF